MRKPSLKAKEPLYLGIECGATHTAALLADRADNVVRRVTEGPANLRLLNDRQLSGLFQSIARQTGKPASIAIGMAGARTPSDLARIRRAAEVAWLGIPCYATNDLETALIAAPADPQAKARVLLLSGTGSCCFGQSANGRSIKIGGWGHLIGDKGSGYEIGLRALKAVVYHYDRDGKWPPLGQRLLRALQMNEPNDFIPWVQKAEKADIAALAREVFDAFQQRDPIAGDILSGASSSLARDGIACAKRRHFRLG